MTIVGSIRHANVAGGTRRARQCMSQVDTTGMSCVTCVCKCVSVIDIAATHTSAVGCPEPAVLMMTLDHKDIRLSIAQRPGMHSQGQRIGEVDFQAKPTRQMATPSTLNYESCFFFSRTLDSRLPMKAYRGWFQQRQSSNATCSTPSDTTAKANNNSVSMTAHSARPAAPWSCAWRPRH